MANFSEKQMNAELFRCFFMYFPASSLPKSVCSAGTDCRRTTRTPQHLKIVKFFRKSQKDIYLFPTFVEIAAGSRRIWRLRF